LVDWAQCIQKNQEEKVNFRLVLALLVVLGFCGTALAADGQGSNITIRPFLQNINISPADKAKDFDLIITNGSSFKQVFHLSTVNFGALNDTGGIVFQGSSVQRLSHKYGLANWLSLSEKDIELDAQKQASVKVKISNDSSLSPGAHYAAIIVTASNPAAPKGQLSVTPKVSSLVFATKTGGEQYDIHLTSLSHNGNLFSLPTQASVRFKSTGNTFIIPRGVVSVKQGNSVVARGAINQQSGLVLPETVRNFDVPLIKVGNKRSSFLFTNYKVQVDYRYDGEPQYATASFSYSIINPLTIIAILLTGVTIIMGLRYRNRPKPAIKADQIVKLSRLKK
jgi:hypothetical protein